MSKSGCPHGSSVEWETGSRTQVTERGSHASESIHLAGIEPQSSTHIVQLFCMKMAYPQDGDFQWMPGKYCIFKKGDCPNKFQEGYILWDDAAPYFSTDIRQTFKGVLPDGEYNHNTKVFYCCRTDGAAHISINTPSSAPFYLMKFGDVCQEIDEMTVTEEWVQWADEKTANANDQGGAHPKLIRSGRNSVYSRLYYCYYQTKPATRTKQILLILVYLAAGIIGSITILSFLVCTMKSLCEKRHKQVVNDEPSGDEPSLVIRQSSDTPTVYRYVSVRTTDEDQCLANVAQLTANNNIQSHGQRNEENLVQLRPTNHQFSLCQRQPSCVCVRCISLPPRYEDVIDVVSKTV